MVAKEKGKEGLGVWDLQIQTSINSKVLLYSTGNYIQYSVINNNGKGYEKECQHVYLSLFAI